MAVWTGGTAGNDVADWSYQPLGAGETAHVMRSFAGDDWLKGAVNVRTTLDGGLGNDTLSGGNQDDLLIGGGDNDQLFGGGGADYLVGNEGADYLVGNAGNDTLFGNQGDDLYRHDIGSSGLDRINEDVNQAGNVGYGGGYDAVWFPNTNPADVYFDYTSDGTGLIITTNADMLDGVQHAGVVIEKFFMGAQYVIEELVVANNQYFDLTQFLPAPAAAQVGPEAGLASFGDTDVMGMV